ncbi:MAG TPA: secretin N-terminal domain-containing protein [Candidatus Polarisedimenticolia bacterium]|nr:secretin N-terminal domain-containing protein [Candidatus Polarisedimenticolia bacterium]
MNRSRTLPAVLALTAILVALPPGAAAIPEGRGPAAAPAPAEGAPPTDAPATQRGAQGDASLATRVFTIRYKGVDDVYLLVSPSLGPRGSIQAQPARRTLTVSDAPETLARLADLIRAYDIPPRGVEVSVQLILATAGQGSSEPAPPPIRGVIEKLSALSTRWNDYRLVGNARILGTEGERSSLRVGDDYRVDFRIDQVSEESHVIRFKPFELQRREPAVEGNERFTAVMSTVLNLKDSQQFIVGASRMERSNRALFMTITAALQRP